jgi:hypothetical protein
MCHGCEKTYLSKHDDYQLGASLRYFRSNFVPYNHLFHTSFQARIDATRLPPFSQ